MKAEQAELEGGGPVVRADSDEQVLQGDPGDGGGKSRGRAAAGSSPSPSSLTSEASSRSVSLWPGRPGRNTVEGGT